MHPAITIQSLMPMDVVQLDLLELLREAVMVEEVAAMLPLQVVKSRVS